ncbi:hypothetical protein ACU4GD_27475 [Cupriavidus basilensis]
MNIVPEKKSKMMGTGAHLRRGHEKDIHARMKRTTEAIAGSAGCRGHLQGRGAHNATVNQPALTDR